MKPIVCLIIVAFFSSNLYSQKSNLSLYSSFSYLTNEAVSHINNGDSKFGYNGLSLGFRKFNDRLFFREFELKSGYRIGPQNEVTRTAIYNHIRFEFGKQHSKKLLNNLNLQYGLALKFFHFYNHHDPEAADLFSFNKDVLGFGAALFTGIDYDLTERFLVQLKVNLIDFTVGTTFFVDHNPDLTSEERAKRENYTKLFGEQSIRLGVGYKFGKQNKV